MEVCNLLTKKRIKIAYMTTYYLVCSIIISGDSVYFFYFITIFKLTYFYLLTSN